MNAKLSLVLNLSSIMVSNKTEIKGFLQVIITLDKLENETFFFFTNSCFPKVISIIASKYVSFEIFLAEKEFLNSHFYRTFSFFCIHLNIIIALKISNYNINFLTLSLFLLSSINKIMLPFFDTKINYIFIFDNWKIRISIMYDVNIS